VSSEKAAPQRAGGRHSLTSRPPVTAVTVSTAAAPTRAPGGVRGPGACSAALLITSAVPIDLSPVGPTRAHGLLDRRRGSPIILHLAPSDRPTWGILTPDGRAAGCVPMLDIVRAGLPVRLRR